MNITVAIGNTDNKLTQQEWSKYVEEVNRLVISHSCRVEFFGGSPNWTPWQNVAWILEVPEFPSGIVVALRKIREKYRQESAFVLIGQGLMV